MQMTGIEDKKEVLAFIKRGDDFRDSFQQSQHYFSRTFEFAIDTCYYIQEYEL